MRVAERRMDVITGNLANLRTHGYRRQSTAVHAFEAGGARTRHARLEAEVTTDFSQGPLERTSNPLDLALNGSGFFTIDGPNGELYTRAGRFQLTEDGNLVNQDGLPVIWSGGRGTLEPIGEPIVVDSEGNISQGGRNVGQIKIVDFEDPSLLMIAQGTAFRADPEIPRLPSDAQVHQGSLEGSNTSGIDQLVEMIQVQRAFQRSANLMSSIQRSYEQLIRSR